MLRHYILIIRAEAKMEEILPAFIIDFFKKQEQLEQEKNQIRVYIELPLPSEEYEQNPHLQDEEEKYEDPVTIPLR